MHYIVSNISGFLTNIKNAIINRMRNFILFFYHCLILLIQVIMSSNIKYYYSISDLFTNFN